MDKWQYQYKTTGGYGSWTDVPSSGDSTRSYTLTTGLNNGRTYTFRVRGVNAAGNGTESSSVSVSTQPAKPTGFSATAKTGTTPVELFTEGRVDLRWSAPSPANSTITKWQYQYQSKPAGGQYGDYGDWTDIPGSGATTRTYTVTGLTHDTGYKFKIRAVNATGNGDASDESSEAKPVQPKPVKPTGFTATAMHEAVMLGVDGPGQLQHHQVAVQAGLRRLDYHNVQQQRRAHDVLHCDRADQRHYLHLQDSSEERRGRTARPPIPGLQNRSAFPKRRRT